MEEVQKNNAIVVALELMILEVLQVIFTANSCSFTCAENIEDVEMLERDCERGGSRSLTGTKSFPFREGKNWSWENQQDNLGAYRPQNDWLLSCRQQAEFNYGLETIDSCQVHLWLWHQGSCLS